eukprot:4742383-Ditylum_brightwellii.AAC.1
MDCEQKYIFKQLKERIKSEAGFTMVNFKFTGSLLKQLMHESSVSSKEEIARMFNTGYDNAMDVLAMLLLFRSLADMSELQPYKFGCQSKTVMSIKKELILLGK